LLRQLIVASDRAGQEFIMWYLDSAFDAYKKVQSSLQTRLNEMQSAALSPLLAVRGFLQSTAAEKRSDNSEEIRALRQRIAELEGGEKRHDSKPAGRQHKPAGKHSRARVKA
jgi:hypothetical protein